MFPPRDRRYSLPRLIGKRKGQKMRIYWAPAAIGAVLVAETAVSAVIVPRFNIDSKMMLNTTPLLAIGTTAPDFTPIVANASSATYGSTVSSLEASVSSLRISSTMSPISVYRGSSSGGGQYDLLAGTNVAVNWAWGHTTDSGGWRVIDNATSSVVASLTFSQGQFTSAGGTFSATASGNAVVGLSADGSYRFEAYYFGKNNPTSSLVEFTFVVPAPGAIALAGAALAASGGGRRRRR